MTQKKMQQLIRQLGTILEQPFTFGGDRIRLLYCARAKHPKTWMIGTHFHPWFEFNLVIRGSMFTTIGGEEFLVSAGQSFLVPPNVPHAHRHNGTGDEGICLRFSLEPHRRPLPDGTPEHSLLTALSVPQACTAPSFLERSSFPGGVACVQAAFAAWLAELAEQRHAPPPAALAPETLAAQVQLYLEGYYASAVRLADVANALGVSVRSLSRRFAAETGQTVTGRLTQIRMEHARQLLSSTQLPVHEVARRSGFDNEFYFSRAFKQHEGLSPSAYRRSFTAQIKKARAMSGRAR